MKNIGKKVIGAGVATLLVTTAASLNAGAATVTDYRSYAEAQYISGSGSLLGDNLTDPLIDTLAEGEADNGGADPTTGAWALVDTENGTEETSGPYWASGALNELAALTGPLGDALGSTGVGVIGSYAYANQNYSHGASGLVTNEGAVNVDSASADEPANATLSLTGSGMPLEALNDVANVTVDLGAAASSAELTGYSQTKPDSADEAVLDYGISGGGLDIELNALQTLGSAINDQISILDTLTTIDGGALGSISVTGIDDITSALANSTDGAVDINIIGDDAGLISVDVPALLTEMGLDINSLPRNTDLLHVILAGCDDVPELVEAGCNGTPGLLGQVDTFLADLTDNLTTAIGAVGLTLTPPLGDPVEIDLGDQLYSALLSPLQDALDTILAQLDEPLAEVGDNLATVTDAITDVLSLNVNVQHYGTADDADEGNYVTTTTSERTGTEGVFSITALRVVLLAAAGDSPLLSLNLANSLAGYNWLNEYDDNTNADADTDTDADADTDTDTDADTDTNVNANGGVADQSVDTLPTTGASNLWPFWLLGLLLVALGIAAMINEKRREAAQLLA
ncbi:MAG: choice-of-anchor G family protein [Aeromicrobium sp.]|uniref:choice-of-anchor G family protein n=1 Tax=Aeromicrobium sp. TaxID=1871063 RepID=UPI0039E70DDF